MFEKKIVRGHLQPPHHKIQLPHPLAKLFFPRFIFLRKEKFDSLPKFPVIGDIFSI